MLAEPKCSGFSSLKSYQQEMPNKDPMHPSALIHLSSDSGLKSILADIYILQLVVRAVFNVESKGPVLHPHNMFVYQDNK